MKRAIVLLLLVVIMFGLSGCYINQEVQTSEIGVVLDDGVTISNIVGAGRYSNGGWYSKIQGVNISAITAKWEDPDLVTADKQPIGLSLVLTFNRKSESPSVKSMWNLFHSEILDDKMYTDLVLSRVPEAAKQITTKYTLDQMLGIDATGGGREAVSKNIFDILKVSLDVVYTNLITVQVANIAVDPGYLDKLKQKAATIIDREIAEEQSKTNLIQVEREKSETEKQLEIARRANLVNEEMSKAYALSPELFKLKLIEAYKGVFSSTDKVVFIPSGSDLSIIMGSGNIVPVTSNNQPETQPQPQPQPTPAQ